MEDPKNAPKKSFRDVSIDDLDELLDATRPKKKSIRETWKDDVGDIAILEDAFLEEIAKFTTNVIGSYLQILTLKLVWNRVATKVFGAQRITFWQAAGLIGIAEMLTYNIYEEARKTRKAAEAAE